MFKKTQVDLPKVVDEHFKYICACDHSMKYITCDIMQENIKKNYGQFARNMV